MTFRGFKFIALAAFGITFASTSGAETLNDALVSAYNESGLLAQNRAVLRAADEDVAIATSSLMPVISWAISANRQTPRATTANVVNVSASLSAELTVYDGGANRLAIEAQKENVLGTRQALRNIEQQVLLRAVQAYLGVRTTSEFVTLRQNNLRLIQQELRAARDRFEVGEVTRTDVALAEAQLAEARSLLAGAEGDLKQAGEEYKAAVGRAPGNLSPVSPAPVANTEGQAKAFAVRNHPNVLQAQHSVTATELNIARASAAYGPSGTLTGQVGLDEDLNSGTSIGLSFGGPIYSGGRLAALVRQAQAGRDQARAGLHITSLGVQQNVGNAFSFLQVARASKQSSQERVRAAQTAFQGIREEATLGARTTLDVLNAEQDLLDARTSVISTQADEVAASYTVLSTMGLLTADHLKLAVQQYDPTAYYNLVKDAPAAKSEQGRALDRVLQAIGQ